ncbi:MAG: T9SS type A sorting domain-containing protein [Bacteroidia bacterium]|nr:T9SS type A sorting domain-containing protein [Bacteroidia bacterium]
MKFVYLTRGCLLFLMIVSFLNVKGSHIKGANITYECTSGCSYRIFVTEYFDCAGLIVSPPSTISGTFSITGTGGCTAPSAANPWQFVAQTDVTPLCPGMVALNSCGSSPNPIYPGVVEVQFYRDYNFCSSGSCTAFTLSYSHCCRSGTILTLNNANLYGLAVTSTIKNPGSCNESPDFIDPSPIFLQAGQPAHISLAATDAEGDSLYYFLSACTEAGGNAIPYNISYSPSQPLGAGWNVSLDSVTGDVSFTPVSTAFLGEYVFCYTIAEYRNGSLLGTYQHDLSVTVFPSATAPNVFPYVPALGATAPTPVGCSYIGDYVLQAFVNSPMQFRIDGFDLNTGDFIEMTWSGSLPGATFTDATNAAITDTISGLAPQGLLAWTPSAPGRYSFTVSLWDTVCYVANLGEYTFVIDVDNCDHNIAFSLTDSVCNNDTALVQAIVPAGPSFTYSWDFNGGTVLSGSGAGPYELVWATSGVKIITLVTDDGNCTETTTAAIIVKDDCVWPGDADYDGVADNFDLLAIGLSYATTGPARSNASLNWEGQLASLWNDTLPSGVNYNHSDTDGNGVINDDDTLAISLNYGLTHNKTEGGERGGPGDPPLLILPQIDSALVGDTLFLPIYLGVDSIPADSIYGIAFSILYDNTLVDSASAKISYSNGWLGMPGTSLIGLQKDFFANGKIDVALTRNDHISASGFGQIAVLSIVMVDDISGKSNLYENLTLEITDFRVINATGQVIPINPLPAQIVVYQLESTGLANLYNQGVLVYPNPTSGIVTVEMEKNHAFTASVFDMNGKQLRQTSTRAHRLSVDMSSLPAGLYILSVESEGKRFIQKLQVVH